MHDKLAIIKNCERLQDEVEEIEAALTPHTTTQTCKHLFHKLEAASHAASHLRQTATQIDDVAQLRLKKLEEKILTLFGHITTGIVNYEVSVIKKEAEKLDAFQSHGNSKHVARRRGQLKKQISTLCYQHALSMENLKIIGRAKETLEKFEPKREKVEPFPIEDDVDSALQLYEIYDDLSQDKEREGNKKFNQLPPLVQERVKYHSKRMARASFSAPAHKALVTTANELIGGGRARPTEEEMRLLRGDLNYLKNFSPKSTESQEV
jgi:hypothetical protein